jgi:zinc protease
MAFPAPSFGTDDRLPLRVASALLSGLAGRLFEALRERRSLAYTVVALPWLARRGGAMLGYIATSPGSETEAREGMLAELARVASEPAWEAELSRARNYAAGMLELHRQSARTMAADLLEAWVHGTLEPLMLEPDRLRSVSADDVQRVAAAAFRPDLRAEYVVRGTGASR